MAQQEAPKRFWNKDYESVSPSDSSNEHQDKVDFRLGVGTLFRKNRFKITISFKDISAHLFRVIQTETVGNNEATKPLRQIFGSPSTDHDSTFPNKISFIKNTDWSNQFVGFRCPGYTLTSSGDVVQYSKYPIKGDRGPLTIDFVNDQWNFARQFWDSYLKRTAYKHLVEYFDNIKFDIKCEIYNNNLQPFITHKFTDCYAFGIQDDEFKWSNTSTLESLTLDVDYKTHEISYKSDETWKLNNDQGFTREAELGKNIAKTNYLFDSVFGAGGKPNMLGFLPISKVENTDYIFTAYQNTLKNVYTGLKTLQSVASIGSAVIPMVGEIGRYIPFGAVATYAIAVGVRLNASYYAISPQVVTKEGTAKAAENFITKNTFDIAGFAGGGIQGVINQLASGTALPKMVESIIQWVRGAIYQDAYTGTPGSSAIHQKVWEYDIKNEFLLAKFYPLSGNGGTSRQGKMVTTDGIEQKDQTQKYLEVTNLAAKDTTGGTLGANAVIKFREYSFQNRNMTMKVDYADNNKPENKIKAFDSNAQDGGLTTWKRTSYGVIPDVNVNDALSNVSPITDSNGARVGIAVTQTAFSPSSDLINIAIPTSDNADGGLVKYRKTSYNNSTIGPTNAIKPPSAIIADGGLTSNQKETYNNQPIINVVVPSSDIADGGLASKQNEFYNNDPIINVVVPSSDDADGGIVSYYKDTYGPSGSDIVKIIIPSSDIADGGIKNYQLAQYQGPLLDKKINTPEGDIKKYQKDQYGVVVDNSKPMQEVSFSPADELLLKQQVRNILDSGVSFWSKAKYGPINPSTINDYGNDRVDNLTMAQLKFTETALPLINAPLDVNEVTSEIRNTIAQIFVHRSTDGKIIVNDLSNPKVANAAYALYLKNISILTENNSKNDATIIDNAVGENVSSNQAELSVMKYINRTLDNQNTTTRNTTSVPNNSKNNASITIIDNDNTNVIENSKEKEFDINSLSEDKKQMINKELEKFKNQMNDTVLRPLSNSINSGDIRNFNKDKINLDGTLPNDSNPKLSGYNLDGNLTESKTEVDPSKYNLDDYIREDSNHASNENYNLEDYVHKGEVAESSVLDSYKKKISNASEPNEGEKISSDLLERYRKMIDTGFSEKSDGQSSSKQQSC
jgi:hypothetical protein